VIRSGGAYQRGIDGNTIFSSSPRREDTVQIDNSQNDVEIFIFIFVFIFIYSVFQRSTKVNIELVLIIIVDTVQNES
jgi:hypothetical protein